MNKEAGVQRTVIQTPQTELHRRQSWEEAVVQAAVVHRKQSWKEPLQTQRQRQQSWEEPPQTQPQRQQLRVQAAVVHRQQSWKEPLQTEANWNGRLVKLKP